VERMLFPTEGQKVEKNSQFLMREILENN
jgi:hypothetical protein